MNAFINVHQLLLKKLVGIWNFLSFKCGKLIKSLWDIVCFSLRLEGIETLKIDAGKMRYFWLLIGNNHFWTNLVQKLKIVDLNWDLVPQISWICRIQWWCSLSLFKRKFSVLTDSKMQNSVVVFAFSVFNQKYPFLVIFFPKNQTCQLKVKFHT